jgi:hypothetical protein
MANKGLGAKTAVNYLPEQTNQSQKEISLYGSVSGF